MTTAGDGTTGTHRPGVGMGQDGTGISAGDGIPGMAQAGGGIPGTVPVGVITADGDGVDITDTITMEIMPTV